MEGLISTKGPPQRSSSCDLLVLGGAGFLGRHLTRLALAAETGSGRAPTVAIASRDPRAAIHESLLPRTVQAYEVDGTKDDGIEELLERLQPACIINCIALPSLARCSSDPARAVALNCDLPGRLAHWTARCASRLVHVSTDLVFDGEPPRPSGYQEDDLPAPRNEYGKSKLAGEEAVLEEDAGALVVRVPLLYGDSHGTAHGASDALLAALEAGERPPLFTDERRSPLEVGNAALALLELSQRPEIHGRLHVAGPDQLTRYDLGLLVLTARGLPAEKAAGLVRPSSRADTGMAAERPRDVCLDSRRARGLLATPLLPVTEALTAASSS